MNVIKVHYVQIWKGLNETYYFVHLKNSKKYV
jgi:hypothetical protein